MEREETRKMEDNLDYADLAGGEGQGAVLYVQDGLMEGPSGEQYVTIIQDGQTYAIPAADYAAMIAQQDVENTANSDTQDMQAIPEIENQEVTEIPVESGIQPKESSKVEEITKVTNVGVSKTSELNFNEPPNPNKSESLIDSPQTPPKQLPVTNPSQQPTTHPPHQPPPVIVNQHPVVPASAQGKKEQPSSPIKPGNTLVTTKTTTLTSSAPISKSHGGSGMSMQWMTNTTNKQTNKTTILQKNDSPKKHLYPTIQEVVQRLPEKVIPQKKNYKPIRVDNWGIFLLSRLQNYFQKKEYCDLTLRFPTKNAQIKVHKLILNACTEFFCQLERDGKLADGAVDMPANFTPEAVAPIIRFMYTGKLDLKEATYKKLYETAEVLQMSVLTKLMDAQINAPDVEGSSDKRGPKRRNSGAFEEDPVEQMRKIRRIEKRVAMEGKRKNKNETATQINDENIRPCMPGKKLPIWKRRVPEHVQTPTRSNNVADTVETGQNKLFTPDKPSEVPLPGYKIPRIGEQGKDLEKNPFLQAGPSNTVGAILNKHIENSRADDDDSTRHIKIEPESGQLIPTPQVSQTYRKRSPGEKPKIPRRVQEIQQHLMFEKILKTGAKNTVMKKVDTNTGKSSELSIDEVKALMEEQKQRMAAISQDDDDDDFYEDSIDIGDDYIDNVDSPAPITTDDFGQEGPVSPESGALDTSSELNQNKKSQEQESTNQINHMIQPILAEPEPSKKTVRFSLRPGQIHASTPVNFNEGVETVSKPESTTTVLKIIQSSQKQSLPTISSSVSTISTISPIDLPSMPVVPKEESLSPTKTQSPLISPEVPKPGGRFGIPVQVKNIDSSKPPSSNLPPLTSSSPILFTPIAPKSSLGVRSLSKGPRHLNLVPVSKPFQSSIQGKNLVLINSKPQMTTSQPSNPTQISNNVVASNDKQQITLTLPSETGSDKKDMRNELDEALDEFSRVAEEEAEEMSKNEESNSNVKANIQKQPNHDHRKPRRGRPPRWLKEQTLQMGEIAKKKRSEVLQEEPADFKLDSSLSVKPELVPDNPPDQSQVINEVLKKYPNLFKDNKSVKIKIMTKDSTGKNVTKFITLKAQPQGGGIPDSRGNPPLSSGINSLKPIQKVMYTGKRGRPKKVKPGEYDPHQEERKQIEERLMRDYPQLASQISRNEEDLYDDPDPQDPDEEYEGSQYTSLEQVSNESQLTTSTTTEAGHHSLDPSSEAEALSNVASGIAASLGLAEQQQHLHDGTQLMVPTLEGPISHYQPGQAIVMENGQIHIVAQGQSIVNVENSQQSNTGEFIQILTPDGQLQNLQYSLPKSEKPSGQETVAPATSVIQQSLLTSGIVPGPSRIIQGNYTGISPGLSLGSSSSSGISLGSGIAVGPGMMTIAPPLYHNSQAMIPVSTHMMHTLPDMIQSPTPLVQGTPQLVPVSSQLVPVPANLVPVTGQVLPGLLPATQHYIPATTLGTPSTSSAPTKVVHKIVSDWDSDDENQD